MKIAGIVLLCLQALALLGGIANGSLTDMLTSGVMGIVKLIGFCLPAIIGVILRGLALFASPRIFGCARHGR